MVSELQRSKPPIVDFSFKTRSQQSASLSSITIGSLIVTEVVSDPAISRTLVDPHVSFAIQQFGSGTISEGAKSIRWNRSRQILRFTSDRTRLNDYGKSSWIYIRPELSVLVREIEALLPRAGEISLRLLEGGTSVCPLEANGIAFYDSLLALLDVIGRCASNSGALVKIGFDDVLYRLLARMVVAQAGHEHETTPPAGERRSARSVDMVCEYIRENIGKPLTISKMERLTGLTGRSLNYGFQKRFSCSPQEWQRNFLLDEARKRLSDPRNTSSIKNISFELGFSSVSSFGSHYKRRFHETPSETICHSARRPVT